MRNWIAVIALAIAAAAGWYFISTYQQQSEVPEAELPPPVAVTPTEPAAPIPAAEPPAVSPPPPMAEPVVEAPPLPDLEESDEEVGQALVGLVGEPAARRYFVDDNLVSRAVATVDRLDSAQVPGSVRVVRGPEGPFEATADDRPDAPILNDQGDPVPQFVIDPVNYRRYVPYVEMFEALDASDVVQQYQTYKPLFEQAFEQLGYADVTFDQRLAEVIDELLATPEVPDPVRLIKPEGVYLYADPELEALTAGQKMLIRMGKDNAARVKSKLAEIRAML